MDRISILLALITLGCLLGCRSSTIESAEKFFARKQNPYFPLALGNHWEYVVRDSLDMYYGYTLVAHVSRYREVGSRWYAATNYAMYRDGQRRNQWDYLWTYGEGGEIWMLDSSSLAEHPEHLNPRLYADLKAPIGATWKVEWAFINDVKLVERSDSILLGDRLYRDCIKLRIGMGLESDHTESYARGIGVIRKWGFKLRSYRLHDPINGQVTDGR